MKIFFRQIYIEPGVEFPFTLAFQSYLSGEITGLVEAAGVFLSKYGADWELGFTISAKKEIRTAEIRGPSVFKKDKSLEFSVFLPFDWIRREPDVVRAAVGQTLAAVCRVLEGLGLETSRIRERQEQMTEHICSAPQMVQVSR